MWVNRLQRAAKVSKQETRIFTEVYRSRMEPGLLKWPDVDPQVHSKILKARGVTPVHKDLKKRNNLLNCKKCNNSHNTDVFQKTKRARLPSHSLCLSWKSCTRSDHLTNLDGVFGVKKTRGLWSVYTKHFFCVKTGWSTARLSSCSNAAPAPLTPSKIQFKRTSKVRMCAAEESFGRLYLCPLFSGMSKLKHDNNMLHIWCNSNCYTLHYSTNNVL